MTMLEIIEKKKFGQELTKEEITFFANAAAEKTVPDYQLSLAIGREGQNARLAARLTGYKIDIKSETEARESGLFEEIGYIDDYSNDYSEEEAYVSEEDA